MTSSCIHQPSRDTARRRQRGFSLLELSVVLVVVGLLIGAVAVGRDLQRSAANQRLSTDFIQGWQLAYEAFFNGVGRPPGDDPLAPSGRVNGNGANVGLALCGAPMMNAFLAAGIRIPTGRTEGQQDRYVYLDSNGNPQEVQVCFQSVAWSEPGAAMGAYVALPRNVMVIRNVTYSLAGALDQQIDGRSDARFGSLRESTLANDLGAAGVVWPLNDTQAFDPAIAAGLDESQVRVANAFFKMTR